MSGHVRPRLIYVRVVDPSRQDVTYHWTLYSSKLVNLGGFGSTRTVGDGYPSVLGRIHLYLHGVSRSECQKCESCSTSLYIYAYAPVDQLASNMAC